MCFQKVFVEIFSIASFYWFVGLLCNVRQDVNLLKYNAIMAIMGIGEWIKERPTGTYYNITL